MKCIRVGDPHVTIPNLKDCRKLIKFIIKQAREHKVDRVEFMGDLFHTHAVKRLEVEQFWYEAFTDITDAGFPVVALVGNHDQPGKGAEHFSSLDVFQQMDAVSIVRHPKIIDNITYIGYYRDLSELVDVANKHHSKCLIAHATFSGAQYENGFYAEDGVDPALFTHDEIISGHIHKTQQVGKCFYIGTPKWDTLSDANQEKGIWVFEHASDGSIISKEMLSTKDIVTPIMKYVVNEGEPVPEMVSGYKNYIELIGKSAWIKKIKKEIKGLAQIKARPTDRLNKEQSEINDNLTLNGFLNDHFEPIKGIDKKDIMSYIDNIEV